MGKSFDSEVVYVLTCTVIFFSCVHHARLFTPDTQYTLF